MSKIIGALADHARNCPDHTALLWGERRLTYGQLYQQVTRFAELLASQSAQRIGLLADNSPFWVIADLAGISAGKTLVPVPGFFSPTQIIALLADAEVELLLTDQASLPDQIVDARLQLAQITLGKPCHYVFNTISTAGMLALPLTVGSKSNGGSETVGIAKITYTSGSTGIPKGVALTNESLERVAESLLGVMEVDQGYRHLALLPMSLLLENVAGLYVSLLAGASVRLEPLADLGWQGMSGFDFSALSSQLKKNHVNSLIMVPQLLTGLLQIAEQQPSICSQLRLVAVGGAAVPRTELEQAARVGLPLYQGYGLSECGSVVAVNRPQSNRSGSVGLPLFHQRLRIADDGEILCAADGVNSYLHQTLELNEEGWWRTGDIGYFDDEGFLFIEGRKDNRLLTSFGRNISPEWIELELLHHWANRFVDDATGHIQPLVTQAVVLGNGLPTPVLLLTATDRASDRQIDGLIVLVNEGLPDYARIGRWQRSAEPLSQENGLLSAGGLPQRNRVCERYPDLLCNQPYQGENR